MSFCQQVVKASCTATLNLARIAQMRNFLSEDACTQLVKSLVIMHLDYCNIVYVGIPEKDLHKLQWIQNMAAKLILKASHRDSSTQCLKDLHWLPCYYRILFKVALFIHKTLYGQSPQYLKEMFFECVNHGHLHDPEDKLLVVPYTARKTFADCSLKVAGPRIWNTILTKELRTERHEVTFKQKLKTRLFSMTFD